MFIEPKKASLFTWVSLYLYENCIINLNMFYFLQLLLRIFLTFYVVHFYFTHLHKNIISWKYTIVYVMFCFRGETQLATIDSITMSICFRSWLHLQGWDQYNEATNVIRHLLLRFYEDSFNGRQQASEILGVQLNWKSWEMFLKSHVRVFNWCLIYKKMLKYKYY